MDIKGFLRKRKYGEEGFREWIEGDRRKGRDWWLIRI